MCHEICIKITRNKRQITTEHRVNPLSDFRVAENE